MATGQIGDSPGYLRRCLEEFPEICRRKYGVAFDLAAVENKVRHLRRKTPLTFKDLSDFESPENWWFQRYWVFPPEERITPALEGKTFDFWNLSRSNEADLIREILYVFKSIDLVSIILRFIRPDDYAILSSPMQHLLNIRGGRDPVETYLNYLRNVRDIKEQYRFERVADADMALWVLHEKCFGVHRDHEIERACHHDTFLWRLRARNLVAPLSELSDAELANALRDVKPDLAALIACYSFEILIRRVGERFGVESFGTEAPLDKVIEEIPNYGPIDVIRKARWNTFREIRNQLFHTGQLPGIKERALLLEEVAQLEKYLKKKPVVADSAGGGKRFEPL